MKERELGLKIIESGLKAIGTADAIRKNLHLLDGLSRFFVVGIGKCAFEAAAALEEISSEKIEAGIIIDVNVPRKLKKIETYEGSHPLATSKNIEFTRKLIDFLGKATENDLILIIVSGGGSALLCQPQGFAYERESEIVKHLIAGGADIRELNTVRKHLSLARGGFLAKYAYPAKVISFIFSDVPGDNIKFVASGPTVKDTTTIRDAEKVAKKYGLDIDFFIETPKEDKYFEKVKNILVVSNKEALTAMADYASAAGYQAKIQTTELTGEAREAGRQVTEEIKKEKPRTVLLYGGETTVKVSGQGRGGRNQEMVLSALRFIGGGEMVIAFASDGRDNTDVAGAIADSLTKEKAEKLGLDIEKYLADNNSYEFFQQTGDFIRTGPTGVNVSDLIIAIKK